MRLQKTIIMGLVVIFGACTVKNNKTDDLKLSYLQARTIVENGIEAIGGIDHIRSLDAISFEYEGKVGAIHQGQSPGNPHRLLDRSGAVRFDIQNANMLSSLETHWPNFTQSSNTLIRGDTLYTLDSDSESYLVQSNSTIISIWERRVVPLILLSLIKNAETLGYIGTSEKEGLEFEVIYGKGPGDMLFRYYFSKDDNRLYRIEHMDYFEYFGDTSIEIVFSDYREFNGIFLPVTMKRYDNGYLVTDYSFKNIAMNSGVDIAGISIPNGYSERSTQENPIRPEMTTREIENNIYLIDNLAGQDYNVMFVSFPDYLMVLEAPLNDRASRVAIQEIRKHFPEKPIRYVMVTHFHGDHAGGIRTYINEGATIITTPENKKYFGKVARGPHTLDNGSDLPSQMEDISFELVDNNQHSISTNGMEIQFHDMGPTSHVDEILVAYFPEQGILFQGDLFRVPEPESEPVPARIEAIEFYNKITSMNLNIDFLVGAHGPIGSLEDLRKAVESDG